MAHIADSGRQTCRLVQDYRSADNSPITGPSPAENRQIPQDSPESAFNATQGGRGAELKAQYNRQAAYARRYINKWPQATAHEYLTRKAFRLHRGAGKQQNELVIPSVTVTARYALTSVFRSPGKDARILIDSEKTGNWFALGTPRNGRRRYCLPRAMPLRPPLHEATGLPVLMTVDGGNMITVAENARQKWTQSPLSSVPTTIMQSGLTKVSSVQQSHRTDRRIGHLSCVHRCRKAQGLTDFNDRTQAGDGPLFSMSSTPS